ncbi:MAG TPA: hypothetical protein VGL56_02110 [Fimbriimonadaceae bacterium]|jgi:hypothetical protein
MGRITKGLLLLLTAILTVGCGPHVDSRLIGEWGCIPETVETTPPVTIQTAVVIFKPDGTFRFHDPTQDVTAQGTYSVSGSALTVLYFQYHTVSSFPERQREQDIRDKENFVDGRAFVGTITWENQDQFRIKLLKHPIWPFEVSTPFIREASGYEQRIKGLVAAAERPIPR